MLLKRKNIYFSLDIIYYNILISVYEHWTLYKWIIINQSIFYLFEYIIRFLELIMASSSNAAARAIQQYLMYIYVTIT